MADKPDTNTAIWKSEGVVRDWVASSGKREAKRVAQWRLMGELLPFDQGDAFTFLDLGAGTGAAARVILDLYPESRVVLAEYSPQMIKEGTEVMSPFAERFRYVEFDMLGASWPSTIPTELDAVVTSQCVHHLPDERKQGLFHEILVRLRPGAWYINFDPVTTEDRVIDAAWQRVNARADPESAEKAHHRSSGEQERYENHVRYMIPLEKQLDFLRSAGFEAVDVYWKHLENVIYGGRRPV